MQWARLILQVKTKVVDFIVIGGATFVTNCSILI